jgi:hypothetical protein
MSDYSKRIGEYRSTNSRLEQLNVGHRPIFGDLYDFVDVIEK